MTFPSPYFEYQQLTFYFSRSALFILRAYFTPEPRTTGQLPQRRWRGIMERTDWPWNIYGSLVLWLYEFWQRRHITVTLPPNKRPDVLLCVVAWRDETKCMFFSPSFAFTPSPLSVYKRCLRIFSYRSASLSACCFFLASFILFRYFSSNVIFLQISSRLSVLALSPLAASSSHSISPLISSTLSSLHHIHNDRLMAASASPLHNNEATSIGPD